MEDSEVHKQEVCICNDDCGSLDIESMLFAQGHLLIMTEKTLF